MNLSPYLFYFIAAASVVLGVASVFFPSSKKKKVKIALEAKNISIVGRIKRTTAEPYFGKDLGDHFHQFIEKSELFQPFINISVLPEGFWIDEMSPAHFRVQTPEYPSYGRNYDLFGLDAMTRRSIKIGTVSLVPLNLSDDEIKLDESSDWASIYVTLAYDVTKFFGQKVNALISALARTTGSSLTWGQTEATEVIANKLISQAIWDLTFHPEGGLNIEFSRTGAFKDFHAKRELWDKKGIKPWLIMKDRLEWLAMLEEEAAKKDYENKTSN